jgi:CubicO group peptidase (beta-lactamase class C family)
VRLDDAAVHYVPDFTTSDRSAPDRITLRQLLTHTSGLSTAAGVDPLGRPETTLHQQVLALHSAVAAPQGTFTYSNANYEVLGDVIEHVSGTGYAQYLRTHVLAPLAMTHTYTDLAAARAHGLGAGHRISFGVGLGDGYWYRADFLPAGFLVSTTADLAHYLSALLDGGRYRGRSILSTAGVRALTMSATTARLWGAQGGYGYGWYQRPTAGRRLVVDPGITRNSHADLVLVPERHLAVAVLSDAESALYLATIIPKFDLLAMNVAAIATDGSAATGLVEGLYLVFDGLALAALLLYAIVLVRVLRSRQSGLAGRPWYRRSVTIWREIVVPVVILVRLPGLVGESWPALVRDDVGVAAALVSALGLATIAARAVFAHQRKASSPSGTSGSPGPDNVGIARVRP